MCSDTKEKESNGADIHLDPKQPMLFKVGYLGKDYVKWAHSPVLGYPRLFEWDWVEAISSCAWYIVPIFWSPVLFSFMWYSAAACKLTAEQICLYFLLGVGLWRALEYSIHRFIFHAEPTTYWLITLHFLLHGQHHKFPMDKGRLVFPPPLSVIIFGVLFALFRLALPKNALFAVGGGTLFGYIAYDCLHYFLHHSRRLPGTFLQHLKSKHLAHHYKNPARGFGISNDMFDTLLNTF